MGISISVGNKKKKDEDKKSPLFTRMIWAFIGMLLIQWIWPDWIPFETYQFWEIKGNLFQWLTAPVVWPFFIWAIVFALGFCLVIPHQLGMTSIDGIHRTFRELTSGRIILGGVIYSAVMGAVKPVAYRWLFFFNAFFFVWLGNFFLGGFIGYLPGVESEWGVIMWIYTKILIPIVDYVSLGYLTEFLRSPYWLLGAALLSANATAREDRIFKGFWGWISAFFFGFMQFWVLFQFGLVACIVIQVIYSLIMFITTAVVRDLLEQVVANREARAQKRERQQYVD